MKSNRIRRMVAVWFVNTFLCGTHFYSFKTIILRWGNIKIAKSARVVGPIYIGNIVDVSIGDNSFVGAYLQIYGNGKVVIGRNCDLAPEVAFVTGSHDIQLQGECERVAGVGKAYGIIIEDGCWIGARATLMRNTTVGRKSVIGACSLVIENVNSCTVNVGIPSKKIRNL